MVTGYSKWDDINEELLSKQMTKDLIKDKEKHFVESIAEPEEKIVQKIQIKNKKEEIK